MTLGVSEHRGGVRGLPQAARRGFSLTDVLVTMAVISVLLSILMPSLSSIRETARQVICRSNSRQLGIGITQYAADHEDHVPRSVFVPDGPTNFKPWETMKLRIDPNSAWDGLGRLYSDEYSPAPLVFYCPSHKGDNRYQVYADAWASETGQIIGNYQYRARAPADGVPANILTDRLAAMRPGTTLIADGFRTQADFNHQIGANVFRADTSVAWFSDRNREVVDQLPKDTITPPQTLSFQQVWSELDRR
jgi:prepilin-type N-terminal cleavage/methylation domain-containing protein